MFNMYLPKSLSSPKTLISCSFCIFLLWWMNSCSFLYSSRSETTMPMRSLGRRISRTSVTSLRLEELPFSRACTVVVSSSFSLDFSSWAQPIVCRLKKEVPASWLSTVPMAVLLLYQGYRKLPSSGRSDTSLLASRVPSPRKEWKILTKVAWSMSTSSMAEPMWLWKFKPSSVLAPGFISPPLNTEDAAPSSKSELCLATSSNCPFWR